MPKRHLFVITPDSDPDTPVPSELDVASVVYGGGLPRSPSAHKWARHSHWTRARNEYLQQLDAEARARLAVLTTRIR